MTALVGIVLVLQLFVPVALIAWIAFGRSVGIRELLWDASITATYLLAIAIAGLWLALPWYLPWVYLLLLVAAVASRVRPGSRRPDAPIHGRSLASTATRAVLLTIVGTTAIWAGMGRRPPTATAMDLAFPLHEGTYLVAVGGSNALLNPHVKTLTGDQFAAFRGQSYATDIVAVGGWGSRVVNPLATSPTGFEIFGHPIHAPCAGTVVVRRDGRPDQSVTPAGRDELEGNHVILDCGGTWVLLAHMQAGSVVPEVGDSVSSGDVVGRVGNSGRSDEPHLHIHAQTPGSTASPLSGDPIPITFDGRYPVRNDRIHGTPSANNAVNQSDTLANRKTAFPDEI